MHADKSDFIGNVCRTKMMFSDVVPCSTAYFPIRLHICIKPLRSCVLHAFSYKYSHFNVSRERKEGHLENEVEPMRSAAENFGDTNNESVSFLKRHQI